MTVNFFKRSFQNVVQPTSAVIVLGFFDEVNDKYYLQQPGQSLNNLMKFIIETEKIDVDGREWIDAIEQDTWFRYKMAVSCNGKIYHHLAPLVKQLANQKEEVIVNE